MRRWSFLFFCLLLRASAALAEGPGPERAMTDRAEIAAALDGSLAAGYREKNLVKYLSLYVPESRIVNYIWGEIDRETLGRKTLEDFATLSGQDARVEVLEAQIAGTGALVKITFEVTGLVGGRQPVSRQDRYYLRMRRDATGWVVVEQSYRQDFQSSPAPHGARR